ncbi:helix-turn-helix domain-containing protein [Streptomyces sp. NPDC001617]
MSRPIPEHGTSNRYAYGCRCTPCTRAATRADTERKLDRLAGRPRQIPAGPASEHARALKARGLSLTQIGREAGLRTSTISRLINGQRDILAVNAAKVLAVPLNVRASTGDVPALGATRRIRALYALGHFNRTIAVEAGISKDAVCALAAGAWPRVKAAIDDEVRAAYDRLSMSTGTSWKTRQWAEKHGWATPLAWDDDTIDDPSAVPMTDAVRPAATQGENVADRWLHGESVVLDRDSRREVLRHLYEWTNDTTAEIAAQLEMSPAAAERQWERMKERAAAEGRRLWRRVYVPRERDLTQNEMEEAA